MKIKDVIREVAKYYKIPQREILGKSRRACFAFPRQIAMTLAYELTGESFSAIGHAFNRDHATVMFARRKIEKLIDDNDVLLDDMLYLAQKLCLPNAPKEPPRKDRIPPPETICEKYSKISEVMKGVDYSNEVYA